MLIVLDMNMKSKKIWNSVRFNRTKLLRSTFPFSGFMDLKLITHQLTMEFIMSSILSQKQVIRVQD